MLHAPTVYPRSGHQVPLGTVVPRDAMRILKPGDQPLACSLREDERLNALPRLWNPGWRPRSDHRPAHMSKGDLRGQKSHLHLAYRERALPKHEAERRRKLAFQLRAPFPPPTDHVDHIAIFSE